MEIVKGNLFDTNESIGHGVNTVGLMGAGIAVGFRDKFPEMHSQYVDLCQQKQLTPGTVFAYQDGERFVYNMASQRLPGKDARLEWLQSAADASLSHAEAHGVSRIHIPLIGCGIGGLKWKDVQSLLEEVESRHKSSFVVHQL